MGHGDPVEGIIVRLPKVKTDPNLKPVRALPEGPCFDNDAKRTVLRHLNYLAGTSSFFSKLRKLTLSMQTCSMMSHFGFN